MSQGFGAQRHGWRARRCSQYAPGVSALAKFSSAGGHGARGRGRHCFYSAMKGRQLRAGGRVETTHTAYQKGLTPNDTP